MKTLLLTATSIIILSFSSKADDTKTAKNNDNLSALVAPMVVGSPDEDAPAELKNLLANPSAVPVAPMLAGNADEEAPAELKDILAYPAKVPVAPMALGSPDGEAPLELGSMPAYAVN